MQIKQAEGGGAGGGATAAAAVNGVGDAAATDGKAQDGEKGNFLPRKI